MWIFGFSLGVCPTELCNLVFSLECLVSNGRRALLGGIRLGGSATGGGVQAIKAAPHLHQLVAAADEAECVAPVLLAEQRGGSTEAYDSHPQSIKIAANSGLLLLK